MHLNSFLFIVNLRLSQALFKQVNGSAELRLKAKINLVLIYLVCKIFNLKPNNLKNHLCGEDSYNVVLSVDRPDLNQLNALWRFFSILDLPLTVFVSARVLRDSISHENHRPGFALRKFCRKVAALNWQFEATSQDLVDLTKLNDTDQKKVIEASKKACDAVLLQPSEFFSYPLGAYDARTVQLVKQSRFKGAFSSGGIGWNREVEMNYQLDRVICDLGSFYSTLKIIRNLLRKKPVQETDLLQLRI